MMSFLYILGQNLHWCSLLKEFLKMAFRKSKVDNSENESGYKKPSMSYPQIIAEALNNASEKTLVLSDIYKAINARYPYYKLETQGWQKHIRHVLTINKKFIKGNAKSGMVDNRGGYWKLTEDHSMALSEKSKLDNIKNGNLEDPTVYEKPCMSFAQLIAEALNNAPEKTLVAWHIFKAIKTKYPYYESETKPWKDNIRGILTTNKNFIRGNKSSLGWNWKLADNHSIPPLKVQKVSADSKYKICSECKKGFTSPDEYEYHIAKVHSFVQKGKSKIQYKMKKDIHHAGPYVRLQYRTIVPKTSDKTNIQQTIEKDNSHESQSDNIQNANPWLVENVQAFSFLNCPECGFKVKEENLFQDHAVKNHSLSSVLFGSTSIKTECVYIKTEPNEDITEHHIENEPKEGIIEHQIIKSEPTEDVIELQMIESEPTEDIIELQTIESESNKDIIKHHIIKSEPTEYVIEHHIIKSEPSEGINENQMIESEPNENIIKHHVKTELMEDTSEDHIIDLLDNVVVEMDETHEEHVVKNEPTKDIIEHHLNDPIDNVADNDEMLEEPIHPNFEKKASTYQPNRLKRSVGTVDTSIYIEIPSKMKKNFIFAYPHGDMQESQCAQTSDQTNLQQTMEKDNSNSEADEDPGHKRPYLSYNQLIAEALKNAPEQTLVLSDIYKAINAKYPYYKLEAQGWKKSIRCNLSVNKNFIKEERSNKPGCIWKLSKDVPKSLLDTERWVGRWSKEKPL